MNYTHLQTRVYSNPQTYSLDFYFDINDSLYMMYASNAIIDFKKEMLNSDKNLFLLDVDFYFTQCPHCQVTILTNREHGYKLDCQICEKHHFTKFHSFDGAEDILSTIQISAYSLYKKNQSEATDWLRDFIRRGRESD